MFARQIMTGALLLVLSLTASTTEAQFTQQGSKLVGTGSTGAAVGQGYSVAVSADGNTAIVGGPNDNTNRGAAWVYVRSGDVWSQQGAKLVGTGAVGSGYQGVSVALSGDGNTAVVGAYADNALKGAAWVFVRSDSVWAQQGTKLVGTSAVGAAYQGGSVALSGDGNTALIGGYGDNSNAGAAWVYVRGGGVWSQQAKLVGTGAAGAAYQGRSVALSADGNTAVVGGFSDGGSQGAVWVFVRSGGVWSQQGAKLVGTGSVGLPHQGGSVALSADGNTACVGGQNDNGNQGAAWVFVRSGGVWGQQGDKLVGTGSVSAAYQGGSVALSADGNTAAVGGSRDNGNQGAAWVYVRSGGTWSQSGEKLVGTGAVDQPYQGASVALSENGSTAVVGGSNDNSAQGAVWVFTGAPKVDVPRASPTTEASLAAVAPNPMRAGGVFRYALARESLTSLAIYDPSGRRVRALARGWQPAGAYMLPWDGRDAAGQMVADGVYFVRLEAAGRSLTVRFVHLL